MAEAPVQALLNEATLRRFDPYVKEVLDVGKYVALYCFEDNSWKKSDVEGALFVYSRSAEPLHNILVLNRLNKKNLVEPITAQVDLQINIPFLLYKNGKGNIFGIWFFDRDECVRLSSLIQKLIENCKIIKRSPMLPSKEAANVDIFKMLTKAQEAYIETKEVPHNHSKSPKEEVTPNSVAEFFAKAHIAPQTPIEPSCVQRPKTTSESETAPRLLQQLMANPVHSVEHIEKQQRSVTPQYSEANSDALKNFIRPHSSGAKVDAPTPSEVHHIKRENGVKYTKGSPSSNMSPSLESKKLDLMPPAMFTPKAPIKPQPTPEPLTRNQLLQALDYLLRNDVEFMTKVHEAYVKSLTEKII